MSWKTLRIEGIARIEREVAKFLVDPVPPALPMGFRIKIVERQDGDFIGYSEIAVKDAKGQPDGTSGRGATIEEALADTVQAVLRTANDNPPVDDDSIWWDPSF